MSTTTLDWRASAACRGDAAFLNLPPSQAKTLCVGCPVARVCLWDAIVVDDPYDETIRGGMTSAERQRLADRYSRAERRDQYAAALEHPAADPPAPNSCAVIGCHRWPEPHRGGLCERHRRQKAAV